MCPDYRSDGSSGRHGTGLTSGSRPAQCWNLTDDRLRQPGCGSSTIFDGSVDASQLEDESDDEREWDAHSQDPDRDRERQQYRAHTITGDRKYLHQFLVTFNRTDMEPQSVR